MKRISMLALIILAFMLTSIPAQNLLDVKLRVFEGDRVGPTKSPEFVTSSYIRPTITASIRTDFGLEKEKSQILRVFNLLDVNLLTEADLGLNIENPVSMRHYFRLNSHQYMISIHLIDWDMKGQFLIVVNEESEKNKPQNVLTTEMTLLGGNIAVFGFESREGKPYFMSFYVSGPKDKILPPPPPPPPSPPRAVKAKIAEFEKGAVKAQGLIKPPRLLKRVDPYYPKEARKLGQSGVVILNVRTDEEGKVEGVLVLRSLNEILDKAAIDAVKQWEYEPYVLEGKPCKLVFTVTVRFKLK